MNTTPHTFKEFFARTYSIKQIHNNSSLSQKVFYWFYMSTLLLEEKMALLKLIPRTEADMKITLEILESNYVTALTPRRDQELEELFTTMGQKSNDKIDIEKMMALTL